MHGWMTYEISHARLSTHRPNTPPSKCMVMGPKPCRLAPPHALRAALVIILVGWAGAALRHCIVPLGRVWGLCSTPCSRRICAFQHVAATQPLRGCSLVPNDAGPARPPVGAGFGGALVGPRGRQLAACGGKAVPCSFLRGAGRLARGCSPLSTLTRCFGPCDAVSLGLVHHGVPPCTDHTTAHTWGAWRSPRALLWGAPSMPWSSCTVPLQRRSALIPSRCSWEVGIHFPSSR